MRKASSVCVNVNTVLWLYVQQSTKHLVPDDVRTWHHGQEAIIIYKRKYSNKTLNYFQCPSETTYLYLPPPTVQAKTTDPLECRSNTLEVRKTPSATCEQRRHVRNLNPVYPHDVYETWTDYFRLKSEVKSMRQNNEPITSSPRNTKRTCVGQSIDGLGDSVHHKTNHY